MFGNSKPGHGLSFRGISCRPPSEFGRLTICLQPCMQLAEPGDHSVSESLDTWLWMRAKRSSSAEVLRSCDVRLSQTTSCNGADSRLDAIYGFCELRASTVAASLRWSCSAPQPRAFDLHSPPAPRLVLLYGLFPSH